MRFDRKPADPDSKEFSPNPDTQTPRRNQVNRFFARAPKQGGNPAENGLIVAQTKNQESPVPHSMTSIRSSIATDDRLRAVAGAFRQDTAHNEERNVDQRPPGGGVPDRHH